MGREGSGSGSGRLKAYPMVSAFDGDRDIVTSAHEVVGKGRVSKG